MRPVRFIYYIGECQSHTISLILYVMNIISLSLIAPDSDLPRGYCGNMHDVDAAHGGGPPKRCGTFAQSIYLQGGGYHLSPPCVIAGGEKR